MSHSYLPTPHGDGTPVFMTRGDQRRKMVAASRLQHAWRMDLHPMPPLGYTDFLCARQGRPVGWLVVISRSYSHGELQAMGGIYLKHATWATLRALNEVPLSVAWLGCWVVWDLTDGMFGQHIANMPDYQTVAWDPRGAVNDRERAVLVLDTVRVA